MYFTTRRRLFLLPLLLALGALPQARGDLAPPAKEIPLYPTDAPGSEKWNWTERAAGSPTNPTAQNVVHPVLLYYPVEKSKSVGTAVIVAPGGGFQNLMMSYEGVDIAKRFNAMGADAFVLKYRLRFVDPAARGRGAASAPAPAVPTGPQANQDIRGMAAADGQQAVRLLRQHAGDYGFNPDRLGMIGFSAGGVVALRTAKGPADARPNFAVAIYAGEGNSDVPPAGAPPLFIAVAADDQSVGYQGAIDLFGAWRRANIPVELHVFQTGAHGFGKKGGGADHFMDRIEEWMKLNNFLTRADAAPAK